MHSKLLVSINSLTSWSDKILSDAAGRDMRLSNFIDVFNMKDYHRFYLELLPFVEQIEYSDNPLLEGFINAYITNRLLLREAMRENLLYEFSTRIFLDVPIWGRKADDLVEAIRQIKSNTENLVYELKLEFTL